jgi:hypothetical protein
MPTPAGGGTALLEPDAAGVDTCECFGAHDLFPACATLGGSNPPYTARRVGPVLRLLSGG